MKNVREINKHHQENTNIYIYISGITFPGEWVTVAFFLVSNRALRRKMTGITKCPVTAKLGGSECSRSHGNTPHATFTALFISDYSFRGSFYPQWLVMAVLGFAEGLGCDLKRLKSLKRKTLNPDIPLLAPGTQLSELVTDITDIINIISVNKDSHAWLVEDELVGSESWGTIFLQNIVKNVLYWVKLFIV